MGSGELSPGGGAAKERARWCRIEVHARRQVDFRHRGSAVRQQDVTRHSNCASWSPEAALVGVIEGTRALSKLLDK